MFDFCHQLDFSSNWLLPIDVNKFVLFVDFHSNLLTWWFMESNSNNCICSLTYLFPNNIIFNCCLLSKIRFKFFWFYLDCVWILRYLFLFSNLYFLFFLNLRNWKWLCSHWNRNRRLGYLFDWLWFKFINI